ncbi:hypothetical protein ACFL39_01295 [Gemmatimonadota bacterium]
MGTALVKRSISISGDFQDRGEEYVTGPFTGSVSQVLTSRVREMDGWSYTTEVWDGHVSGKCYMAGREVPRLAIHQPKRIDN